jgi:hypothetical protein
MTFSFPSLFDADDPPPVDEWQRQQNRVYLEHLAEWRRWQQYDAEQEGVEYWPADLGYTI